MRKLLLTVASIVTFYSCGAYARTSFLPENDLHLQDNLYSNAGIDEATFNKVIDKIYKIYAPIIENLGGNLVIHRDWESSVVNAYADREDGNYNLTFTGGLARREEINEYGFAVVVCHEMAHHISGFPLWNQGDWAASEGQSDSGAMRPCMRKYLADVKTTVTNLPKVAIDKCKSAYTGQDLRVCYNSLAGARSCSDLLASLGGTKLDYSLDTSKVRKTNPAHPSAKCRWTTYVASAICKVKWGDSVVPDEANQAQYNCIDGEGARPRCWYAP